MGRIRSIKPEFPQSESIGRLSRDARLLFIQLWTIVDDSGRARAASRMLASLLYPYDDDARALMDDWLSELDQANMIRCYQIGGDHYLEIVNWLKHQKIDKPSASKIPSFVEGSRVIVEGSTTDMDMEGIKEEDQGSKKDTSLRSDCSSTKEIVSRAVSDDYPSDYRQQFWNAYPRKIAKKAAFKALDRVRKSGEVTFAKLIAAVRTIPIGEPVFIKHPATWLNGGCWDDQQFLNGHGPPRDIGDTRDPEYRHRHRLDGII